MRTLGAFELNERIGRGGMAEVWSGVHRELGLPVAIKVVAGHPQRFVASSVHLRNEVRAMAQLDHPNVVTIFDHSVVAEDEQGAFDGRVPSGTSYFAMELADGGTAKERCGVAPWSESRGILLALLDALAHAHARGVLHRDVKPSNVLRFADGATKLSDFGLAHPLDPNELDGHRAGGGTPAYMAPEQFERAWRDYDCATDLYAVGCVAHALVCGRPPYGSWGDADLMARLHQRGEYPPFEPTVATPEGLGGWIRQLVQPNPRRRYRRAADAAAGLLRLGAADRAPANVRGATNAPRTLYTLSELDTVSASDFDHESPVSSRRRGPEAAAPAPVVERWARPELDAPPLPHAGAGLSLFGLREAPFVGRRDERTALWEALTRVAHDLEPRAVLLEGAAGAGKSRLAAWLCQRAHEVGAATVLKAVHSPREGPAHGLAAMVTRYLRLAGLDRTTTLAYVSAALAALGESDAEAEPLTDVLQRGADGRDGRRVGAQERHTLLRRFVSRLAAERVVILWLDDVQWGLDALQFTRRLLDAPARVLVVLTARSEELARRSEEQEALGACLAHARSATLEVGPLPETERVALVERALPVVADLAEQVAARAGGSPLFTVQLLGAWVDAGALRLGERGLEIGPDVTRPWPRDLDALWDGRLEQLLAPRPPGDRVALEIAAVLGQTVDAGEWHEVCALSGSSPSDDLVEDLLRRRLATTGPRGPSESWAFVHGTLRERLEETCQRAGRRRIHHRRCAEMLATHPQAVERMARHWVAAGEWERALGPLAAAARQRLDTSDFVRALELVAQRDGALAALSLEPGDARHFGGATVRARVALLRGDLDEALVQVEHAREQAARHGWDRAHVEASALRGRVLRQRGRTDDADRGAS